MIFAEAVEDDGQVTEDWEARPMHFTVIPSGEKSIKIVE